MDISFKRYAPRNIWITVYSPDGTHWSSHVGSECLLNECQMHRFPHDQILSVWKIKSDWKSYKHCRETMVLSGAPPRQNSSLSIPDKLFPGKACWNNTPSCNVKESVWGGDPGSSPLYTKTWFFPLPWHILPPIFWESVELFSWNLANKRWKKHNLHLQYDFQPFLVFFSVMFHEVKEPFLLTMYIWL